jgi:hypothetical protein
MKFLVPTEGFQNAAKDGTIINSPSWRHCFVEGTKVLMGNRTYKNIEDVQIGDTVLTYNFTNSMLEINPVLEKINALHHSLIKIVLSNNEEIISTEDHPYYVRGKGWCSFNPELTFQNCGFRTVKMEVFDFCFTIRKRRLKKVKIVQICRIEKPIMTFNLSKIANSNNYFVNGILVNNEKDTK